MNQIKIILAVFKKENLKAIIKSAILGYISFITVLLAVKLAFYVLLNASSITLSWTEVGLGIFGILFGITICLISIYKEEINSSGLLTTE